MLGHGTASGKRHGPWRSQLIITDYAETNGNHTDEHQMTSSRWFLSVLFPPYPCHPRQGGWTSPPHTRCVSCVPTT